MRTLRAFFFVLLSAIQLKAEITVKTYKARMAGNDLVLIEGTKYYIRGLGEGMEWANTSPMMAKKRLFCSPPNLGLSEQNFIDILNKEIEVASARYSQKEFDELFIGMLLIAGLEKTFPCTSK